MRNQIYSFVILIFIFGCNQMKDREQENQEDLIFNTYKTDTYTNLHFNDEYSSNKRNETIKFIKSYSVNKISNNDSKNETHNFYLIKVSYSEVLVFDNLRNQLQSFSIKNKVSNKSIKFPIEYFDLIDNKDKSECLMVHEMTIGISTGTHHFFYFRKHKNLETFSNYFE